MIPVINEAMLSVGSSLAASMVAKATVTTTLGLIGARLARRNRAAVRHALLAAAFGVLLVLPIASVIAPPVRIAVPVGLQERTGPPSLAEVIGAIPPITPEEANFGATSSIPQSSKLSPSALLVTAWIAGVILFLLPVIMGLRQVRSLRRSGLPWRHGQSVVEGLALDMGIRRRIEVLLHEALPGPMTYGVVHPAIMLPRDAQAWEGEDLNRAIVHELEHVRRGDWISHCLARVVCAVYWFHPLVWIAWRQLALEAERSCDDAVVGRSEAIAYADQLVGLAQRFSMVRKSPALAMANRADLATRVGALLDNRQRRGRAGAYSVALACAAAALLVIAMSPVRIVAAPQSAPAQRLVTVMPEFDVVSVKPSNLPGSHEISSDKSGRLSISGTMHRFIIRAYGITDWQLSGEPDWFNTQLYVIEAVGPAPTTQDQMMLMLRGVLADRFQLKLRQEYRDLPIFALEVAAGGPKFHELKPGELPSSHGTEPSDIFAGSFTSVQQMTNKLNGVFGGKLAVDRPIVDRTNLKGNYDIYLRTGIETQTDDAGRRTFQFPDLVHDVQAELGLKLASDHARMPYFVVEQAAAPTPN
jgi:uncharacterized protein (TIGR03435 family)